MASYHIVLKFGSIPELYQGWKDWRRWLKDRRLNSGTNTNFFVSDVMSEMKELKEAGESLPFYLQRYERYPGSLEKLMEDLTTGRWPKIQGRSYCPKCGCGLPVAWSGNTCSICRFRPAPPPIFP